MDGIEVERVQGATVVIVREISDEFRIHVRDRLAEYCYGAAVVCEDTEFYSFEKTVSEFLERYEPKPDMTRLGMAGELIVHVLMPVLHEDLTSAAVYFNKEERSIKKGFDLTFLGSTESAIWYGEVKSGEVADGTSADEKAEALIDIAASSLFSMLDDISSLSRWDAALIDAGLTLELGLAQTARKLLRSDSTTVRKGGSLTKRVILAGAVMHEFGRGVVTAAAAEKVAETIASSAKFSEARIIVIQQDALEAVIEYLREVANGTVN
ncbi:hypothetical protein [Micrococcus luteus]|uniref:hypothetical protein n=1 Tax=Micrococcus luteus TaxID=1270 RepID=UPI0011AB4C27|nr:hypothetical protein [Micrococcus luteus]